MLYFMGKQKKTQSKYITLKEASQMTGYSPDYLGQLIRKGKLEGKQVYLNVAWMTTEDAVREYFEKNKTGGGARAAVKESLEGRFRRWMIHFSSGDNIIRMTRRILYLLIVVVMAICLFLGYAVVANILRATGT